MCVLAALTLVLLHSAVPGDIAEVTGGDLTVLAGQEPLPAHHGTNHCYHLQSRSPAQSGIIMERKAGFNNTKLPPRNMEISKIPLFGLIHDFFL